MGSRIRCFVLEPLDPPRQRLWLRRYVSASKGVRCPLPHGYHNAMALMGDIDARYEGSGRDRTLLQPEDGVPIQTDARWPTACVCGFAFSSDDGFQPFTRQLYRRIDTGEVMTIEDAPPGAMWFAWWNENYVPWCGADGRSLMVKTPGGEWCVDSRCSNCTRKDDTAHKCWVRHGSAPDITVDKNGNTCAAGAGSIAQPRYHGFLRGGWLEEC